MQARVLARFDHGVLGDPAVDAADDQAGQLAFEVEERFGEQLALGPAEALAGRVSLLGARDEHVAAAVIAVAARLEHHRPAELVSRGDDSVGIGHVAEGWYRQLGARQRLLLQQLVLDHANTRWRGPHADAALFE